jgi:hypothetical protein
MIAISICILAFVSCLWAGKRSLGQGLVVLLAFGYFYGILRANLITTASHFIFDGGLLGLYMSQKWMSRDPAASKSTKTLELWTIILIGWCVLIVFLPFQPLLVSLVGLRGNIYFLPLLILGSRLKEKDLLQVAGGMAVLNIVAVGFAWAEYILGVPRFYPFSEVTLIIYSSGDVAGGFLRIPAIFSSAHAYGGSMVNSMPYLIGAWDRGQSKSLRTLALGGTAAAMIGILMSATRLNFIFGSLMVLVALAGQRHKKGNKLVFVALIGIMAFTALTNSRFQRFKSLGDADTVQDRIAGSVNRTFFEILLEYPMGNGLGGGGTSTPYFLQGQVRNPIGMENEYARILCEQGIIGLLLWIAFILWFLGQAPTALKGGPWASTRRMVWCLLAFMLSTAWMGIGFFTAIPQTVLQLLGIGWTSTWRKKEEDPPQAPLPIPARLDQRVAIPAVHFRATRENA